MNKTTNGQQLLKIAIPEDLEFSDLHLAFDSDGYISFDLAVIERICQASGFPAAFFMETSEDNVSQLLVSWYDIHRQRGGAVDPVAEALIAEIVAEERANQTVSYKPGNA